MTWFIDCATDGICGVAITPTHPNRGSILAALRCSIMRDDRYGPFGGVPAAKAGDQEELF
ncbi:hypothetical protein GCM10022224_056040 [Nonomuraea antimicrobica]|uniref:Uncharacterized protein n=1 Tax=Nonomuraea antimicrobica TaxID=561173 RepID=A0ABP7CDC6_9ACTN